MVSGFQFRVEPEQILLPRVSVRVIGLFCAAWFTVVLFDVFALGFETLDQLIDRDAHRAGNRLPVLHTQPFGDLSVELRDPPLEQVPEPFGQFDTVPV